MPDAIDLLKIRRSVKPREMEGPGPSPVELETILTIGARSLDRLQPENGRSDPAMRSKTSHAAESGVGEHTARESESAQRM
jgi:hypothetical protein